MPNRRCRQRDEEGWPLLQGASGSSAPKDFQIQRALGPIPALVCRIQASSRHWLEGRHCTRPAQTSPSPHLPERRRVNNENTKIIISGMSCKNPISLMEGERIPTIPKAWNQKLFSYWINPTFISLHSICTHSHPPCTIQDSLGSVMYSSSWGSFQTGCTLCRFVFSLIHRIMCFPSQQWMATSPLSHSVLAPLLPSLVGCSPVLSLVSKTVSWEILHDLQILLTAWATEQEPVETRSCCTIRTSGTRRSPSK